MIRFRFAPGVAAAANGLNSIIHLSFTASGAGGIGAALTVTSTLDAGAPSAANGIDATVVAALSAGAAAGD